MAKISYSLQNQVYYKKSFLSQDRYSEVELLENFSQYKNSVQIIEDYFFMYQTDTAVYKSTCSKNKFVIFMLHYDILDDKDEFYKSLSSVSGFTVIPCRTKDGDKIIFAWPVYTEGKGEMYPTATLGFFISPGSLGERIKSIAGDIKGDMYVYHYNKPLLTISDRPLKAPDIKLPKATYEVKHEKFANGDTRFTIGSLNERFQIVLDLKPDLMHVNLNRFAQANIIYLSVIISVMLAFAILLGYVNHLPIKKLTQKYKHYGLNSKNEFLAIENLLDSLLSDKETAEAHLQKQYIIIKRQILELILSGDSQWVSLSNKSFMGIKLPGPYYCIKTFNLGRNLLEDEQQELSESVEGFLNENTNLYFSPTKHENYYAFILSLTEKDELAEVLDFLNELLNSFENCTVGVSPIFEDIKEFPENLALTIMEINIKNKTEDFMCDENSNFIHMIFSSVRSKDAHGAVYFFRSFVSELHNSTPSLSYKNYVLHNLLYRLSQTSQKMGNPLSPDQINFVLSASNLIDMYTRFEVLLHMLCESSEENNDPINIGSYMCLKEILEYIGKHFTDNNLSLNLLSEKFGLSNKHISKIIKEHTRKTYIDYLTSLRVREAQRLLLSQRYTVTEVCKQVGYTHLPHFINVFKNNVGQTPFNYMKLAHKHKNLFFV